MGLPRRVDSHFYFFQHSVPNYFPDWKKSLKTDKTDHFFLKKTDQKQTISSLQKTDKNRPLRLKN